MTSAKDDREFLLAGEPLDATDATVLAALRAHYDEHDPVPPGLVERIQFELTLDALYAEVATLTQLDLTGSGARGGPVDTTAGPNGSTEAIRTITFSSDSLTTMVTLTPQPDGTVRVDGWASPGAGIRVEAVTPAGSQDTSADDDGRFVFPGLPPGLVKFVLHVRQGDGDATVVTPTLEL